MRCVRAGALCVAGALVLLLGGCESSTEVVVRGNIPAAVVDRIPLSVAVYYDPSLGTHAYIEDSEERPGWRVESGSSQVTMFRQVFADLFQDVTEVQSPDRASGAAGILVPEIVDMQFATPRETRLEFYEAWVKYALSIRDPDGAEAVRWVFTAYGKSPTGFMQRKAAGINAAMEQALRAAGAKMITQFKRVPDIERWIASKK